MSIISILATYLAEDPEDPFNHYAYALEWYKQAPAEAVLMLEETRHRFPEYVPLYYTLGTWYADEEEYDKAVQVFSAGISQAISAKDTKAEAELKRALLNAQAEL